MQSKKYSESNGEIPFDWKSFLERKDIQDYEWESARKLSVSWVTCACGNLCESIPRFGLNECNPGMPEDFILSKLGSQFHSSICNKRQNDAINILKKIECRSHFILTHPNIK